MTLVSDIITDAYRQSNLIPIGVAPTSAQQDEGLRYLIRLVKSAYGNEIGEPLQPFPVGSLNINRPQGWPWYNGTPPADWFVPENVRLMCNQDSAETVYLHPQPDDGARFGVLDIAENFSITGLTIQANGRRIEGQLSLILNTDGENREWFYREDLGEWVRVTPLTLVDTFPFPEEFDFYFITLLAMTINPAYGVAMSQETVATMKRAKTQLIARYSQNIPTSSELALRRLPKTSQERQYNTNEDDWAYDADAAFNTGQPW